MSAPSHVVAAIRAAGPSMDGDVVGRLARVAPATLLAVATSTEAWWVKRAAVRALAGRVDDAVAAALVLRVIDPEETTEVREEAMKQLAAAGRTETIPVMRRLRAEVEAMESPPYGLHDAVTVASARLGDPEAIRPALALRYDAWSHRRRTGEEAVAALEAALGRDGIARLLGAEPARDPDPFVRRWAIDVAPPGAAAFAALTDPDWRVAEGAHEALLRAGDEVTAPLAAQAREARSPPDLRARAILVLLRRGQVDLARQLWRELDARIALPGVPAAVRAAVLRAWLPGERGSDPRWQLEGELDLDPGAVEEPPEEILDAARSALAATGLRVGDPIPIGEVREQGSGTYVHIPVEDVVFEVSELGRYYATLGEGPPRACEALGGTGFLFIDDTLGATRVGGLCVYYFGRRDPLRVHELLFYWQD